MEATWNGRCSVRQRSDCRNRPVAALQLSPNRSFAEPRTAFTDEVRTHTADEVTLKTAAQAEQGTDGATSHPDHGTPVDGGGDGGGPDGGSTDGGGTDGSIRGVDPKLAVFYFMGAVNWMTRWFRPDGELSGADIAAGFSDLLNESLRSRG